MALWRTEKPTKRQSPIYVKDSKYYSDLCVHDCWVAKSFGTKERWLTKVNLGANKMIVLTIQIPCNNRIKVNRWSQSCRVISHRRYISCVLTKWTPFTLCLLSKHVNCRIVGRRQNCVKLKSLNCARKNRRWVEYYQLFLTHKYIYKTYLSTKWNSKASKQEK
jgi:hypothetical protein